MSVSRVSPLFRTSLAYSRCSGVELGVEQQVGHADDAVHGRADLMAHVGEELALGPVGGLRLHGHFVGPGVRLFELFVGAADPLLRAFASGDVAGHVDRADHATVLVAQGRRADAEVSAQALLVDFRDVLLSVAQSLRVGAKGRSVQAAVDTLVAGKADALLRREPELFCHGPVGADDPVLKIEDSHKVGDTVEGPLPFLFRAEQGRLSLLALGNIPQETGHA